MLSYQHSFHAGNAADIHKHLALVMLLTRLRQKDKPFCFIDSHAGRGVYDLDSAEALKTREAESGFLRLANADAGPGPVREYLELVSTFNRDGRLRFYPGSTAIAQALLREDDRAIALELHPQESAALRQVFAADSRISVHVRDCYEGLPALLPPRIRRGLVLIDPSYENKREYEDIVDLLARALERWASGTFLLWYPVLPERRDFALRRGIEALKPPKTLVSEFRFSGAPSRLQGSGLVIVNAPWNFAGEHTTAMQQLADIGAIRINSL